ncbi:unnamed protein product [Chrysoparadoxa australica]
MSAAVKAAVSGLHDPQEGDRGMPTRGKHLAHPNVIVAVRVRPPRPRQHTLLRKPEGDPPTILVGSKVGAGTSSPSKVLSQAPGDRQFSFDHVFWGNDASQEDVYEAIGHDVVDKALQGFNACVFAFGQTGSGKTYTMLGSRDGDAIGLIPRVCDELLQRAPPGKESESLACYSYRVSFVEIYKERVSDLLGGSKDSLKVREHPSMGPYVEGAQCVDIHTVEEINELIKGGQSTRITAETNMNEASSRSHAILTIEITCVTSDPEFDNITTEWSSKINLVDLAGSENAKLAGSKGNTLKEGAAINKSLLTLGRVIKALAEPLASASASVRPPPSPRTSLGTRGSISAPTPGSGIALKGTPVKMPPSPAGDRKPSNAGPPALMGGLTPSPRAQASPSPNSSGRKKRPSSPLVTPPGSSKSSSGAFNKIPYRDSVLTFLLKESLGGNSCTTMIATIRPDIEHVEETVSTLRYANQAKGIVSSAVVNESPVSMALRQMKEKLSALHGELSEAKGELAEAKSALAEAAAKPTTSSETQTTPVVGGTATQTAVTTVVSAECQTLFAAECESSSTQTVVLTTKSSSAQTVTMLTTTSAEVQTVLATESTAAQTEAIMFMRSAEAQTVLATESSAAQTETTTTSTEVQTVLVTESFATQTETIMFTPSREWDEAEKASTTGASYTGDDDETSLPSTASLHDYLSSLEKKLADASEQEQAQEQELGRGNREDSSLQSQGNGKVLEQGCVTGEKDPPLCKEQPKKQDEDAKMQPQSCIPEAAITHAPTVEGFLLVKGVRSNRWTRCWFEVRGGYLLCYRNSIYRRQEAHWDECLGRVPLAEALVDVIESGETHDREEAEPFRFAVLAEEHGWTLQASSNMDRWMWVSGITRAQELASWGAAGFSQDNGKESNGKRHNGEKENEDGCSIQ